jgi:hypothetical protein
MISSVGRLRTWVWVVLFLVGVRLAWGGVGGSISGLVTDPTGAVIPGAEVVALNTETGVKQTLRTDAAGFYSFPTLLVGPYEIEVSQAGFKEYRATGLIIDVNTALRVDVTLQLGAETQRVTVSGTALHVETASTQMGEVITNNKMTTLPLNGRAYTDLLALQPGVVPVASGIYSPTSYLVSGELNPGGLSVSGMRETSNGFRVNGGLVMEMLNDATAIIPNLDSIAEFRILTNNFDAEYGNYNGGQINAVTKSGTNRFHGDAYEFLRNSHMDARNFFSPSRGSLHRNQFGGTFGGPIRRDKIFFFADYDATRKVVGVDTGKIALPSMADRTGNLADVASQLTGTVNGPFWAQTLSQELGYPVTPGEPYYTSSCTSTSQCVFPSAIIPQSAFSAPVQHLLQYIPQPNVPGGFFATSAHELTLRDQKGSFRLDGNSRWGMLSAYYNVDDSKQDNPYPSANVPGFNAITPARTHFLTVGDTKSFGAAAVNEFRFNYMRFAIFSNKPAGGVGPKLSSLGFVEGSNTLGMVASRPEYEGIPPISFNNFSIGVSAYGGPQYNNLFQWSDNLSKVTGTHTLKFGGEFHYDQVTSRSCCGSRNGTFAFAGTETGSDFADFLIGAPSQFVHGGIWVGHFRTRYYGVYAQDNWRVRPNLTLNYGLRWEVSPPWWETRNQLQALVPGLQSRVFPGAPEGWDFVGDAGIPSTIAPTRYSNFAPRIGLAYTPSGRGGVLGRILGDSGKTSIRAGFGFFYTALEGLGASDIIGDAPFTLFYVSPVPPLFTTPFVDRATGHSEGQRYPVPAPPVNVSPSNPDNSVNWSEFIPISYSPAYSTTNRVPYSESYNFSLQRQFGTNTLLSLSYVGTQGHRLESSIDANPGNPTLCLSVSQPSQVLPGTPTCGPFGENGVYYPVAGGVINSTRGPFGPNFGAEEDWYATLSNSNYNALEVAVQHRSGPLDFLVGYTFSKSLDNSSGLGDGVNPFNPRLSRALSAFDLTHNFVISYSYELPFEKLFAGTRSRLTRGWVVSGITRFATGLPVTLTETDDNSFVGAPALIFGPDEPNHTPGPLLAGTDPRSGNPYFNTSLFAREPPGQLGTANRRFFHGPGINNWDVALMKNLQLTESKTLQLRGEFFNIFNHAQFSSPNGNITSSAFGLVTSAAAPRIGQVGIKFIF